MKKFLLTTSVICFSLNLFAQAPDWQWAKSAGGSNSDFARSVTTDANGNAYVTGDFRSDSVNFGNIVLMNSGEYDVFVATYDSAGSLRWARSAGGDRNDEAYSASTDHNGNVYVCGYFQSDTIFFGTTTLVNSGPAPSADIFLVKFDIAGNVVWARGAGGPSWDESFCNSVDAEGNIYLTGRFSSDTIVFGNATLTNTGFGEKMFLVKYDSAGNVLWARSSSGFGSNVGQSVAADMDWHIYVTGYFSDSALHLGNIVLQNAGGACPGGCSDAFIAKYDSSGNLIWANSIGGNNYDFGTGISADLNGNAFITGGFSSDSVQVGNTLLTNAGASDILVVKYDSAGIVRWAKSARGNSDDLAYGNSVDANGNLYLTGYFQSDTLIFGSALVINAGGACFNGCLDLVVAKFNSDGNLVWVKSNGGVLRDGGTDIRTDAESNVYVTGWFESNPIILDSLSLFNAGGSDMLLAKLNFSQVGTENLLMEDEMIIFPNPSTAVFIISYRLSEKKKISVKIYDITGRLVNTLAEKVFDPGSHQLQWDATNKEGGIYFVTVAWEKNVITKKLVVTHP